MSDPESYLCFICMDYVAEEHYICSSNGKHRVCIECKNIADINKCELCKSNLYKIQDSNVINIYSKHNVVRYCSYKGCPESVTHKEFDYHLSQCDYAPIECPNLKCDHVFQYNASVNSILMHLVDYHNVIFGQTKNVHMKDGKMFTKCAFRERPMSFGTYGFVLSDTSYVMVNISTNDFKNEYLHDPICEVIVSLYSIKHKTTKPKYSFKFNKKMYNVTLEDQFIKTIQVKLEEDTSFDLYFEKS